MKKKNEYTTPLVELMVIHVEKGYTISSSDVGTRGTEFLTDGDSYIFN